MDDGLSEDKYSRVAVRKMVNKTNLINQYLGKPLIPLAFRNKNT